MKNSELRKLIQEEIANVLSEKEVDEAFLGFGKKDPAKEKEKALAKINSKPVRAKYFKELQASDPEKAEKMIAFFIKNSDVPYIKWDSTKKDYVDATTEKSASGLTGTRTFSENK
jgi:hypothetical protein